MHNIKDLALELAYIETVQNADVAYLDQRSSATSRMLMVVVPKISI
jgi:hypothetical protein